MTNIQKQSWEERFDDKFVKDNGKDIEPSFKDPNGDVGAVKQFISQEIQKAYQKGIVDAVKELEELGYNKEAEKKQERRRRKG